MSEALSSGLDLAGALRRTAAVGFAHVDGALEDRFRRALWGEVAEGPLRRMAGTFGKAGVRMEIEGYDLEAPFEGFPTIAELAAEVGERVRRGGRDLRGLATWRPNEAGIGVYRPGSVGITAHLDGRWYRRLVAVFTLTGSARFEIRSDREGELLETWRAGAGSLALMRGPGLAGARDGRPFHAVHGPKRGVRCSLALRMSVRRTAER
ncbi:MAG: hypothetical protein ACRDHU_10900 [Actinomycetota bacterium]